MAHLIDKDALVAEIEKRIKEHHSGYLVCLKDILSFLNTLDVVDPYEQCVQYDSIKGGIQAQAETYSFNIESELYNQQTTKEGQKLWRKEIEQAFVFGGEVGVELARDPRYKENLEVKDVDTEDAIEESKDRTMRDMAWKIHVMISEGKGISEIDRYVCNICDF